MLIVVDWCWFMLFDSDWFWLLLIAADWCWVRDNREWHKSEHTPVPWMSIILLLEIFYHEYNLSLSFFFLVVYAHTPYQVLLDWYHSGLVIRMICQTNPNNLIAVDNKDLSIIIPSIIWSGGLTGGCCDGCHSKFCRFNNPSQFTAGALSTHTILGARFSFFRRLQQYARNSITVYVDLFLVDGCDSLWSFLSSMVCGAKYKKQSVVHYLGGWAIPIDCLVISDDLLAHELPLQWDKNRSERLLEREMDEQPSTATIVWNHRQFVTLSILASHLHGVWSISLISVVTSNPSTQKWPI